MQRHKVTVSDASEAHDADFTVGQLSPLDFFYDTVYRGGAIPADIFDNRLRLGARLMVEEMNEDGRIAVAGKQKPAGRLGQIV